MQAVADKYGETWYDTIPAKSLGATSSISEDLALCLRMGALDIPIHVHTGITTSHLKPIWLSHEHYSG